MRCLGIQVLSGHGKAVETCIINAFYSGEDLNEWAEDALVRYMLCKSAAIGTNLPVEAPDNSSASQSSPVQNTRKQNSKAKQAQSISKRFKEDEGYSSDVSDPTTPAKTRERYLTAIEKQEIDRIDHTTFLHHILKSASNDFFFSDISGRDPRPRLGEAFELLERRFETHEKQLQFRQNLTSMTLESIQRELSVEKRQALTQMYNRIFRFTPSCPPETGGNRNMLCES
jgi:hypothetical protein